MLDVTGQWLRFDTRVVPCSSGLGESCDDDLSVADSMRTVLLTLPEIPYSNNKKLMAAALKLIGTEPPAS